MPSLTCNGERGHCSVDLSGREWLEEEEEEPAKNEYEKVREKGKIKKEEEEETVINGRKKGNKGNRRERGMKEEGIVLTPAEGRGVIV